MEWIYLSPHLDDVALSCGGLVWEQTRSQEVSVWTICAGDPPAGPLSQVAQSLHDRWGVGIDAVARRRAEDLLSCQILGAKPRHFTIPDCIYRRHPADGSPLYGSEQAIMGDPHPVETDLVDNLCKEFASAVPRGTKVVCPLGIGGHVDHRLVRTAAEKLGFSLWYYADYPYVDWLGWEQFTAGKEWRFMDFFVSEAGLEAWVRAVAAHRTQISTFWSGVEAMNTAIQDYHQRVGGVRLWRC